MMKYIITLLLCACLSPSQGLSSYPIPEFEMVVVESIPENINLNMSLKQIEEAKHTSKLQQNKKKIYNILSDNLSPLLSNQNFTDGYNLFSLAKNIPAQKIVQELIANQDKTDTQPTPASDFILLILPKTPSSNLTNNSLPYSHLYSSNKASVIDASTAHSSINGSYSKLINERITKAINFSYNKNYVNLGHNQAFFIGALAHVHLDGSRTSFNLQIIGGLPVDIDIPFEQKENEAHFKSFRFPRSPKLKWLSQEYTNHPGTIISLSYGNDKESPLLLNIKFGSLGLIDSKNWDLKNDPFNKALWEGESLSAISYFKRYNTPHLFGEILSPLGVKAIDWWLSREYDLKMNIHEVSLDLFSLEIKKIRILMEMVPKENMLPWTVLKLPTIEQTAVNAKFVEAGNQKLAPYQETLKELSTSLEQNGLSGVLTNPEIQNQVLTMIDQMLENTNGGQQ